ncbi:MAG: hypothetical protein FJ217_00365 [Ignavibacteria bacterium]|nr:hypothetical protein [Ignavibacteria bacterium]
MHLTTARIIGMLALSTAIVSACLSGEKLRYAMSKGSTYAYLLTQESKAAGNMMGQEFKSTSTAKFWLSLHVQGIGKDGEFICVGKIDTAIMSVESPMMRDTALIPSEFFGKRVGVTLSPTGKTLSASPIDTVPPVQRLAMLGMSGPADIFRRILFELPEQEVAIGDSWKNTRPDTSRRMNIQIIVKPNTQYKIAGTEKVGALECYKIDTEGTASQYGTGQVQGMEIVIDGTIKSKGTIHFALKEGLLVGIDQTTNVEATTSGTGEQMFTQTTSSEQKTTIKLIR